MAGRLSSGRRDAGFLWRLILGYVISGRAHHPYLIVMLQLPSASIEMTRGPAGHRTVPW